MKTRTDDHSTDAYDVEPKSGTVSSAARRDQAALNQRRVNRTLWKGRNVHMAFMGKCLAAPLKLPASQATLWPLSTSPRWSRPVAAGSAAARIKFVVGALLAAATTSTALGGGG